jgi:hypothetical protein
MLDTLKEKSKIFIFQADRMLSEDNIRMIKDRLKNFISQWSSHGASLKADFFVYSPLFIVIGVDESFSKLGGCSKDAMNREIQSIGNEIDVDFFNRLNTAYLNQENKLLLVDMSEFKSLAKKDLITQDTLVYNNLIELKSELEDSWKLPVKNSWHKNMMSIL